MSDSTFSVEYRRNARWPDVIFIDSEAALSLMPVDLPPDAMWRLLEVLGRFALELCDVWCLLSHHKVADDGYVSTCSCGTVGYDLHWHWKAMRGSWRRHPVGSLAEEARLRVLLREVTWEG